MASASQATIEPPFRPALTNNLTHKHLTHLARCLSRIEEAHGFDTDQSDSVLITFVNAYSFMLHEAGHVKNSEASADVLSSEYEYCKEMFLDFVTFERRFYIRTTASMMYTFPSFEDLWNELLASFEHIDSAVESGQIDVCSLQRYHGKTLRACRCFAFEYLQKCDLKYTQHIKDLFYNQPVYTDLPSDYDRYVSNRLTGQDPFFGLTDALRPFIHDSHRTSIVLKLFGEVMAFTLDLFSVTSYTPSTQQVNVLLDECAHVWGMHVESFLTGVPRSLREAWSGVNARGVAEALVHRCREIVQQGDAFNVGWFLHVWVFGRAITALSNENPAHGEWLKQMLRTWDAIPSGLIDQPLSPEANYVMHHFEGYTLDRQDLGLAGPGNQQDVQFVPAGPDLDPLNHADLIQVSDKEDLCVVCQCEFEDEATVKLRTCDHILHLECVRYLINGIEPSSNLCPLDRKQICPPRPRRADV
ncbi:uncharacterized protein N0V89_008958 [Didymosphaeria variabile]|uniref:RING-type domain-containing protein n=1 Tax=Didymosphaeria variabile TaxID=1932322 RepID=A0A9W8XHR6_9PLEO|nr:uncharacterized protein N0V89_008958 [Didymosphaeria variabile]KAJ4350337.1 hypothetical protein N0V89_008958 [Didymosphaeria variabile]